MWIIRIEYASGHKSYLVNGSGANARSADETGVARYATYEEACATVDALPAPIRSLAIVVRA